MGSRCRARLLWSERAHRGIGGGFGQPVFVGSWFCGLDYPGFYGWHSDGCVEPDFNYRWFYDVDLSGRDREFAPRKGLVTLFHFPGYACTHNHGWGIVSKRSVIGTSRRPGESAEISMVNEGSCSSVTGGNRGSWKAALTAFDLTDRHSGSVAKT